MQDCLLYCGAGLIISWGIGHMIPTRGVVSGFGDLGADNRRILTMEWIAEGLTLCFLGVLVVASVLLIGADKTATHIVARACALLLFALAGLSAFTGARTTILPMKLCPYIKSAVGIIYILGTYV